MTANHVNCSFTTPTHGEEIRGHLSPTPIRLDQLNLSATLPFPTEESLIPLEDLSLLPRKLEQIFIPLTRKKLEAQFKQEFLRRIPADERNEIIDKVLASKPLTKDQLKALKQGEWEHPVFQLPDWPILVFQAYLNGHIDEMQASKLFLYDQCHQESDLVETLQLINADGTLNEEAADVLLLGLGNEVFRTEEEKRKILQTVAERIRSSPEKGQFFVAAPRHLKIGPQPFVLTQETDVAHALFYTLDWSYCLVENQMQGVGDQSLQFVLPPELGYEILKAKYGDNTMVPLPALSFSEKERFSETRRRVVGIPCRYVTSPGQADGFSATGLTLYHHDMAYHIVLDSANYFRKAWVELARIFKEKDPELYRVMLDRELLFYIRSSKWGSKEEVFWLSLVDFMREQECPEIALPCAQYILKHGDQWKEKYGLEGSSLASASRLRIDQNKFSEKEQQKMIFSRFQTRQFAKLFQKTTV